MNIIIRQQEQYILTLATEIEGYKKSIQKEQEQNEKLTHILNKTEREIDGAKKHRAQVEWYFMLYVCKTYKFTCARGFVQHYMGFKSLCQYAILNIDLFDILKIIFFYIFILEFNYSIIKYIKLKGKQI